MTPPPLGITTRGTVTRVIDGDTVELVVERTIRVRLLNAWAPETRTKDPEEKARGFASKRHLAGLCEGKAVRVHIPAGDSDDIDDSLTLSRVLGQVWLEGEEKSLSEHQVEAGFAKREKN